MEILPYGKILTLAAYKQARRALRGVCELHSASQSEVLMTHTNEKRKREPQGLSFSFLVEVWRFELQASSTRSQKNMFFEHYCLHIVRIFR